MFLLCLEGPPLQPAVGRGLLNHSIHPAPGRSTITAVHEKGLLHTIRRSHSRRSSETTAHVQHLTRARSQQYMKKVSCAHQQRVSCTHHQKVSQQKVF